MPFFSVIIPLYNKEDLVEQTINSLLNQLYTDFEVIIVNDGSTDNSLKKIESLIDDRFKIVNQKNLGASHARNRGIDEASGSYIALLDADDYWYDNHLLELKKLIDTFPEAGLFCNNYEINYNEKFTKPATFNFIHNNKSLIIEDYFSSSIINSVAWTSSVAFKKETFNKIGGFNPVLEIAEDLDLWIRFALNYYVCFNPKITMTYNKSVSGSLSKKEFNDIRYRFVNNYPEQEQKDSALKLYLDINRYAVALRCKMTKEIDLYKKLKSEIDFKNLNFKQKVLINCPLSVLKGIKLFQQFLINNNIYLTAYK
ncbi:glycosyltransferase family 2 protein [Thalassobellus suaedae]|uniref:Glycosyltransferase n=1 Tax=Thalassobellus suaedae TaxID=3074124 RepID=A0ABY9XP89_9FLAO|nr:glycosyltransferase [Flavobacteriaceae bacterium HL-DH14]